MSKQPSWANLMPDRSLSFRNGIVIGMVYESMSRGTAVITIKVHISCLDACKVLADHSGYVLSLRDAARDTTTDDWFTATFAKRPT